MNLQFSDAAQGGLNRGLNMVLNRALKEALNGVLPALALLILLAPSPGALAQQSGPAVATSLTITLAPGIPRSGVISTRKREQTQLQVQSGQTVSLSRASGRDYQLQAGGAFVWTQVQQVPAQEEAVVLTPTRVDEDQVSTVVAVSLKQNDRLLRYNSTLLSPRGEWVQLFGPPPSESSRGTVYSTGSNADERLFMKVDW